MQSASKYFRGGLNCTQAVLYYFQEDFNLSDELIACMAGGGKAPDGCCGALYAVHQILDDPVMIERANHFFQLRAGSTKCREVRKLKQLSCAQAVDLAAALVRELKA